MIARCRRVKTRAPPPMSDHLDPIPWLDVLLLLALIGLNGVLAMSELAIVSSREARLKAMARSGSSGAQCALDLAAEPGRFLSTVQSGITLIAIFAGAFSGATLGEPIGAADAAARSRPEDRAHGRFRRGHRPHDLHFAGHRRDRAQAARACARPSRSPSIMSRPLRCCRRSWRHSSGCSTAPAR